MYFQNPTNGYVEHVCTPVLYVSFFGIFYLAVRGLWGHVFLSLLIILTSLAFGAAGVVLCLLMWIIYACNIRGIIRRYYLRRGWFLVTRQEFLAASGTRHLIMDRNGVRP
jgi:hypothetical protein